ncbi:hypothetical protein [Gilliamella apicola]|uniref:hypothetical protein n=1 Tax=Gilliamella apicola TaxID=1196095 RepID=UPI00080E27B7|nr:hypothetical protein [Gilliamella apicola]OCG10919.1 hypothetical protein A9G14_08950 [Gilliamella apicola]ORF43970.1 hypothetical protein B5800_13120 [Gilliamella apicola]ORF47411.1 hypothetical protein B5799_12645 [Gilliamella apicola]ORF51860.1 hypothetical protein B5798_12745 [Gilliamella apicola]ORF51884.1 hypothetical protein B5803_06065 [Gilliamella apicola]
MIKKTFYLLSLLITIFPTYAQQIKQERVIPRIDQLVPPYLSTILLLSPCADISLLGFNDKDDDTIRIVDEAKAAYPANTCNNPALANKLFKAHFLQYSTITLVDDPWNLDVEIVEQNRLISQCKDTACLDKVLDSIISQLYPRYISIPTKFESASDNLCISKVDLANDKKMDSVIKKLVASLSTDDNCGSEDFSDYEDSPIDEDKSKPYTNVLFDICKSNVGDLFIAECKMFGNQVNTQTWFYLLNPDIEPKQLFNSYNGPYYPLDSTCNGMPDFFTSARYSSAEHKIVYYRYNGQQYEAAYSYMQVGISSDDNDMAIADLIEKKEIICK